MKTGALKALLTRDRLLWYRQGLVDAVEAVAWSKAADTLLAENNKVRAGKPSVFRTPLGTFRLGVWGRTRSPVRTEPQAELHPRLLAALGQVAAEVRALAAEFKGLSDYVLGEATTLELQTVSALVKAATDELERYDRPLLREINAATKEILPGGTLFHVDEHWALLWEKIEPDAETARRVREDPGNWIPPSIGPTLAR